LRYQNGLEVMEGDLVTVDFQDCCWVRYFNDDTITLYKFGPTGSTMEPFRRMKDTQGLYMCKRADDYDNPFQEWLTDMEWLPDE